MKYYNIPIFVPHEGCPFDCIFCNQHKITGQDTSITGKDVFDTIESYLKTYTAYPRFVEAAFFGGSFTGISENKQEELLRAAYEFKAQGKIDGIRLSTRPDYISKEILDRLLKYGVTTIELGVQSLDSEVLEKSARGHTAGAVEDAVRLIHNYPFKLGLQMMTGLPGDEKEKSLGTADKIISMKPDFVRIYPTLVLPDTKLCDMYENGLYTPQSLEEAIDVCKTLLTKFRKNGIDVIRVALATTDEIREGGSVVAGPVHSAFRELCEGEIYYDEMVKMLREFPGIRAFSVNPREISKVIGNKKKNVRRIETEYGFTPEFIQDKDVMPGDIKVWKE